MGLFDIPGTSWVQVGELGLAFIVVILSSSLVTFVMKTSAKRENELLKIIEKVLPVMEKMAVGMASINLRLENIEESIEDHMYKPRKRKTEEVVPDVIPEAEVSNA